MLSHPHFIAFKTILRKEIIRFTRIWAQTILPSVITTVLYFVIFGNLIGSRIGSMDGFRYIQYIAPGLIMMAVINNSYTNVVSSFYSIRFQKSIEELLVSPTPNWIILLGYISGGVARGLMVGAAVTVITLFFTKLQIHNLLIVILVIFFSSLLFSLAGMANAIFARSFDDVSIIPTFVLTPLTYFGGVFFSIKLLPPFWQHLSMANPILYMVSAFRYGILGVSDINVVAALSLIVALSVALFGFNLFLLNRGIGIRS